MKMLLSFFYMVLNGQLLLLVEYLWLTLVIKRTQAVPCFIEAIFFQPSLVVTETVQTLPQYHHRLSFNM